MSPKFEQVLSQPIMFTTRVLLACLSACLLTAFARAQPTLSAVRGHLEKMNESPSLRHAQWGFALQSVATGQEVVGHRPDRALATASTTKVLTSGMALDELGPDHTFTTDLAYDGTVGTDSTLRGNVYVRGTGDPTLGSERFPNHPAAADLLADWAARLRAAGIRRVAGAVVGDGTRWPDNPPEGWPWQDLGNYYAAGAGGLNFAENLYYLYFSSGPNPGDPTKILRTEPALPGVTFENAVLAGAVGSGDQAYIFGAPRSGYRYVSGTIPPGRASFRIKGSVPDPALFCARQLTAALRAAGIAIDEAARTGPTPAAARVVHTHRSPPLSAIIRRLNQRSINLYAEALLRAVAYARYGEGTNAAGVRALRTYWTGRGLPAAGFHPRDGSGLSPTNTATPTHLAMACRLLADDEAFVASLAMAGRSGTLRRFGKGTAAEGRVRAKSGSLKGVLAYTGLIETSGGETYSFAVMANHYDGSQRALRRQFERLLALVSAL